MKIYFLNNRRYIEEDSWGSGRQRFVIHPWDFIEDRDEGQACVQAQRILKLIYGRDFRIMKSWGVLDNE